MKAKAMVMHMTPARYEDIEAQLIRIFSAILFAPIIQIIQAKNPALGKELANSGELEKALRTGRIQWHGGIFSGTFNARISKELSELGATWDKRMKVYRMDNPPAWVRAAAALYTMTATQTHEEIKRALNEMQESLERRIAENPLDAEPTVKQLQMDFKPSAEALRISPTLAPDSIQRLADGYSNNMKLWIKTWSEDQIKALRQVVEKNALAGNRFDTLVDEIKMKYSTTEAKAKFLARQETALFSARFRQERFGEAGVTHYKWSTSHDSRVRPTADTHGKARLNDHRDLDGEIFAYANPPIVNKANGKRANPGQDWNCRCIDIPILTPLEVAA